MSEDFLSRWSRRKRAAQRTDPEPRPAQPPPDPTGAPGSAHAPDPAEDPEQAVLAEGDLGEEEIARLPRLDELTADSDITIFMRKGVPESLRNAALRRMWSLDPKIRDYVSEAREYAYDWNTPGGVPGFGGPLPPEEEIRKMAARIVGALKPETGPPVEAAGQESCESSPSQSGESPGSAPPHETKVAALPQPDATLARNPTQVAKPLEELSSVRAQPVDRGADPAPDDAGAGQDPREQSSKLPRPSRHGGAMPV